ncbi:MAG: endonuclease/exonuclease/phosphatase family protein [Bacteroidales bacterium]|nr:endonuclease/exonuclease/phosphatase family protein [Bacteroidales bacterium]
MRRALYNILLAVNIFFAFALLISYLAAYVNPGNFALPAIFGLAYPYILLINILLIIIWAVLLKFEAFISIAVIAVGFAHFSNFIRLNRPDGGKANTFKIISYNLRLFNYFENKQIANSEVKVLNFLKTQKPDILCLQEYFVTGDPPQKEEAIKTALGGKYYSHVKVFGRGRNKFYGIATFSKFPIINKGEIVHPGSASLTIYTDVLIRKDTFRIYNNHLQSFRLKKMERSFFIEMTNPDDKVTGNDIKSLYARLKKGFVRRAQQAQIVKDNINRSPYPVIVLGDFNDTPVSYSYRKLRKGLNDSFVNTGYGAGFTYTGNYPPNRIDYILYDNALINSYFEIIKVNYSDHYPIVAYFRKKN